ncbi:hypothetical protein (plasmid) [Klebsiella pneumoniae]|nr:hypothetical protein [Klebsiella pneumoniae]
MIMLLKSIQIRNLFTCFYARQGMEGDRAGLHRTPAANRRKLRD